MKAMPRIIINKIRCTSCGDVIESKSVHNYVTCSCGRVSVDGGKEYLRRGFTDYLTDFEDLSEYDVKLEIQKFLVVKTQEGMSFEEIKNSAFICAVSYHGDRKRRFSAFQILAA